MFTATTRLTMIEAEQAIRSAPPKIRDAIKARIARTMMLNRDDSPQTQIERQNWIRDIIRQSVQDEADEVPLPPLPPPLPSTSERSPVPSTLALSQPITLGFPPRVREKDDD